MSIHTELARLSIESYLDEGRPLTLSKAGQALAIPPELLNRRAGVFVTLHLDGRLRGCIGTIEPQAESIAAEIIRNAVLSASEDPRFSPVKSAELPDITISVDVLGENEPATINDLDPKRYGVIVEHEWRRGLLLPNLDGIDTVEEQVAIALQKAGISQSMPYKLFRFEVVRHE
ncbi:MAG TPA: AmmeMemoRadiSam system protein A [Fastidiosipila sp.]|nr:AmmeMemoRadiSam system protein A [Fastidiosipila sp.]